MVMERPLSSRASAKSPVSRAPSTPIRVDGPTKPFACDETLVHRSICAVRAERFRPTARDSARAAPKVMHGNRAEYSSSPAKETSSFAMHRSTRATIPPSSRSSKPCGRQRPIELSRAPLQCRQASRFRGPGWATLPRWPAQGSIPCTQPLAHYFRGAGQDRVPLD